MIVAGLTGSIGMGKSTTAKMFADDGVPVHDADAVVHELYRGAAVPLIESAFPGATVNGEVNRDELAKLVLGNPDALKRLEAIVHPLVRGAERAFLKNAYDAGHKVVILDIPLLFETGGDGRVDAIIVVTAPAAVQRRRVLARQGMTEDRFEKILARQMPDAEKRRRADYLVDSGRGFDDARRQVAEILENLRDLPGKTPSIALREALEA